MSATSAENRQLLRTAFTSALGVPPEVNVEELQYQGVPQWDSMAHMILVQEIETALNVMLSTDEVIALSSFEKAVEIVGKHGVDARA